MTLTFESLGVIVACCVATATGAFWAALVTFQLRRLDKSHRALREVVIQMIDALGLHAHLDVRGVSAAARRS